jgi:MFS family permease
MLLVSSSNHPTTKKNNMLRRSVVPLLVGTFILRLNGGAGNIILGRFLAELSLRHGRVITNINVGMLSVAFFVTELTLAPVMGAFSDRWGRRIFLTTGPVLGLIQVALLFFTPAENALLYLVSLQVLAGISSAMQVPAVLGYLADYTAQNPARRMRFMSFYELATSGGLATGVAAGGFAWDRFGRFSFGVLAFGYLLVALCMLVVPKVRQIMDHGRINALATRYWRIIRTPRLFIFIPAWISIAALLGVWLSSQLTFILSDRRHLPHQYLMGIVSGHGGGGRLSIILGAYVLFFGLCLLFWAFFLNRVPRLVLMLFSVGGVYLGCIALYGINSGGLEQIPVLVFWIVVLMLGIFAETAFAPAALAYLADVSEEAAKDRGLLMGLYSVFLGLGQLVGNGLGGVFAQVWGFNGLIYLTALLALIALISLLFLFRQERRIALGQQHPAANFGPAE